MTEEFKVGDIVECLDANSSLGGLSLGTVYTVIKADGVSIQLIDDNRIKSEYFYYRFKKISSPLFPVNDQGGVKDTVGKLRWTLLPWQAVREVVKVLEYGALKYSADNWKKVEPEKYKEAAFRHWLAYIEGEKLDPETGYSHLAHLACDILFILWMELTGKINE